MADRAEAQKMVDDGWSVFINKTGTKLTKTATIKPTKKSIKKDGGK